MIKFLFLISLSFITSCGDSLKSNQNTSEKDQIETEKNIKTLLTGCSFKATELNSSLPDIVITLGNGLSDFKDSLKFVARKQGVLLSDNKVLTTLKVHTKNSENNITYIILVDGSTKKILHSVPLEPRLSVIDVFKKSDTLFGVDALVREAGKPASKINTYLLKVENNLIVL